MNKKISLKTNSNTIMTLLYLTPIFINNIDLGPNGEHSLRLQALTYPALILFHLSISGINKRLLIPTILLFLAFTLYSPIYLFGEFDSYSNEYLKSCITLTIYFISTIIFIQKAKSNPIETIIIVDYFCKATALLVIISFITYHASGIYILADDGYGFFRPHALMSEPSAMSFVLAYGLTTSLRERKLLIILVYLCAIAASGSLIVILTSLAAIFIYYYRSSPSILKILILLISVTAFYVSINYVLNFTRTDGIFDNQIIRLKAGFESIFALSNEGYNPRMNATIEAIKFVNADAYKIIFGYGPLSDTYLPFGITAGSAPSLPLTIFFNFGIIGLIIFIVWVLRKINMRSSTYKESALFSSLLVACVLNSAQGLLIYQLLFAFAPYEKKSDIVSRPQERSR